VRRRVNGLARIAGNGSGGLARANQLACRYE